jgi:RNA polymerase sigma-70 factor (ECF subfamily)
VEEVIRRARDGDPDALGHLWRTYQHLLLRYFRAKRMADPEDLASTVWLEVASSLARFEGDEHDFRRWLFTIAARRRIDDIRSATRTREHLHHERAAAIDRVEPSAGEEAERAASLEAAIERIRSLPADQAEAILLRVVADLGVPEVAAIMGRREGTVRVLVHRGLRRLEERAAVTNSDSRTMSAS